jgi:predicted nucleotidyltransferase
MLGQNEIKKALRTIAPKYGVESVYLFGSYARGDASEDSDFDFRIIGGNFRSLYDLIAFRLDLEDKLGREVDVVQTKNMRDAFYRVIKDEEVLVYG